MEMTEFERELARDLARVDAPLGFAERVMLAAAQEVVAKRPAAKVFVIRRAWAYGAIAAVLLLSVAGGERVRHERQKEQAREEFEVGMQVTDRTLEHVQEQLQRAGVSFDMTNNEEKR